MERASTCSLGEEGGVTELRCYHGFKFHTQPAPGRPWTCQTARRRRQHLPRHRQQQAGGKSAGRNRNWNHPLSLSTSLSRRPLGTHVAGQISRRARQACIPRRRKDIAQKGLPGRLPVSFLPSPLLSLQTATIAGVKSVPIPSCCCALFPFVKIVIYSVLNFSLLAPQIWHNKTFNVVTAMLQ